MPRLWIVFGLKGMTYLRNMDNAQPSLISLKLFNFFIYGTMVIFTGFFQLYLQDIGMSKIEIDLMAIAPLCPSSPIRSGDSGDRAANIKRVR